MIGTFDQGKFFSGITLKQGKKEKIEKKHYFKLENNGEKKSIRFTGYLKNGKPVAGTHARINYDFKGNSYCEEGTFNENFQLEGIGTRSNGVENGNLKSLGEWINGELHGDGLR